MQPPDFLYISCDSSASESHKQTNTKEQNGIDHVELVLQGYLDTDPCMLWFFMLPRGSLLILLFQSGRNINEYGHVRKALWKVKTMWNTTPSKISHPTEKLANCRFFFHVSTFSHCQNKPSPSAVSILNNNILPTDKIHVQQKLFLT